jgi:hypothetical protein
MEGKGEWEAAPSRYIHSRQDCAAGVCSPESGPSAVNSGCFRFTTSATGRSGEVEQRGFVRGHHSVSELQSRLNTHEVVFDREEGEMEALDAMYIFTLGCCGELNDCP